MSEVKIIHLADVHYSPDHKEEALASLRTLTFPPSGMARAGEGSPGKPKSSCPARKSRSRMSWTEAISPATSTTASGPKTMPLGLIR